VILRTCLGSTAEDELSFLDREGRNGFLATIALTLTSPSQFTDSGHRSPKQPAKDRRQ
jgi:hypothetical protein